MPANTIIIIFSIFKNLKKQLDILYKNKSLCVNISDFPKLLCLFSFFPIAIRPQSPRSQLRKTGKVTQTSMFRTNKIALVFMTFEQNEIKQFFFILKNPLHIFWLNSFGSVNFFLLHKHACLPNFPEIRGTENSG